MEKILEAPGKNYKKKAQRAKRVYAAPKLVRISKVVSETRYDRDARGLAVCLSPPCP